MSNKAEDNYLKKELYALIKADESIFEFIQESSLDGLWYWDLEKPENEWMSPKFWTVLGHNPLEMPHKASAWQHIINQEDLKTATENFTKHCENPNHPYDQIVRYTHKNGSTVWIRCRGIAIRDKNGNPIRMLGAHHDITILKNNEIELIQAKENAEENEQQLVLKTEEYESINEELTQTNEELYKAKEISEEINANVTAIIEGTADSIWAFDRNYIVLYINNVFQKEFKAAFGVWLEKGSSLIDVLPEPLRAIWKPRYDRALLNEQFTVVDEVETAIGKLFIQVSFNPIVINNRVIGGSCFGSNITQRMHAEEALRKSEANLRNIIESSPVGYHIYMLESDSRLVFRMYNPSADMMLHVTHEQFVGQDILEAFPALAGTGIPEMYMAVAKGELKTQNFEIPYNNQEIKGVYDVRVFQGAPGQAVVNFTDITERKRAEEAILKSEARLHTFVANQPGVAYIVDANGVFTLSEGQGLAQLGLAPGQVVGLSVFEVYKDVPEILDHIKLAMAGEVQQFQVAVGKLIFDSWIGPVIDDDGNIVAVIGIASDITERKRAEEALQESQALYHDLVETSQDLIWQCDAQGRYIYLNPAYEKTFGYQVDEMLGRPFTDFQSPMQAKSDMELLGRLLQDDGIVNGYETVHLKKDGTELHLVFNAKVVFDANGNISGTRGTAYDITERKLAEEALQESQALYHDLVETSQDLIWQCDAEGHYIYLNLAYEKTFGYRLDEMLGRPFTDFISPLQSKRELEIFSKLLRDNGVANGFESVHLKKDGTELHMVSNAKVVFDAEGQLSGTRGTAYDITERKRAEEALRNSERKARAILDKSIQFIGLMSRDGILLDANMSALELAGVSKKDVLNKPFWEGPWWNHSVDLQNKLRESIKSASAGEEVRFEATHPLVDGSLRYVDFSLRPVKNEKGDVIYLIPEGHDITERKKTEHELQCNFNFQEIIADISSNFVISSKESFDNDILDMLFKIGNYFQVDRGYLFLFSDNLKTMTNTHEWCADGISPQKDSIQNHPLDSFPWLKKQHLTKDVVHIPNVAELPKEAVVEKEVFNAQSIKSLITIPVRSKNKLWGFVGFDAVKNGYEWNKIEIKNLVTISNIISNLLLKLRNEEHLLAAKEKAEESDRLKTAFLQNMSHEIRTPMNAIMGFSNLLPEYFDDKERLEDFSKIINQRSEDLLDIINDILNISKIESGQNTVNIEECNLNDLFAELASFFSDYQNRTNKQHIKLILQPLNDAMGANIKTDKVKLKQILVNLISNAFKFTETGAIRCGCEEENNKLKFYVSDTGVGIPKLKFDFIFERFTQLNNSSCQNIGGTGLGLPIVKGLVELLGGKVWLESECDKGTTFFFSIDYAPCGAPPKTTYDGDKNNNGVFISKRMLIVEDELCNAIYLYETLKNYVANIYTVHNGTDAIEFVKNNTVDVVLMDVRLPDITGYEATQEILKHNPAIIVIAQTAYAAQDEHNKALSNGCVDYISKPIKQEQLLPILRKHLK